MTRKGTTKRYYISGKVAELIDSEMISGKSSTEAIESILQRDLGKPDILRDRWDTFVYGLNLKDLDPITEMEYKRMLDNIYTLILSSRRGRISLYKTDNIINSALRGTI